MSILTITVLGALFSLLYVTALAAQIHAREPVWLNDVNPANIQASRLAFPREGFFIPGDSFDPCSPAPTSPVRWIGFQDRPAETDPVEMLRQAAVQGDRQAQFNLGRCYESGRGVARDPVQAVKWFRQAADQGHDEAQYTLGCCYNGEDGFPRDSSAAIKWWSKAAAQGHADAQYCLGLSCYTGQGTPLNLAEAAKWWGKAAAQDHADAQYFLGLSYHKGHGVPQQETLALYWLRQSASHGNANARVVLGKIAKDPEFPARK